MRADVMNILQDLISRYPTLGICKDQIIEAYEILVGSFLNGGKLLVAGNGGSAADSEHISGELIKSFVLKRPVSDELRANLIDAYGEEGMALSDTLEGGLPVIPLTSLTSSGTAFANDKEPDVVFAQLVNAIGTKGDVFLGITTSGNSKNVLKAMMVAKSKGMTAIGLSGSTGGKCKSLADVTICVPETETYKIQEYHLPVYHALCMMIERTLFDTL